MLIQDIMPITKRHGKQLGHSKPGRRITVTLA